MYVDDGAWASKLALRDRAQATANHLAAVIKAANIDAELPENVMKLSLVLGQVQDTNFSVLDNLRETDQAHESLQIPPPPPSSPHRNQLAV
ncbi:hypothetical protein BGW39_001237 [Mortierella sp. 14UC]|nr:hypothetical protein BGW39_001237 [Mortierella sp. 14UC]